MSASMRLGGAAELIGALDQIEKKTRTAFLKQSLRDGAAIVRNEAQADAPVLTGTTRKAIAIRAARSKKRGTVSVSVGLSSRSAGLKKQDFYPKFVEFGHFAGKRVQGKFFGASAKADYHKASTDAGRKFIPGRHFLEKAANAVADAATAKAIASLWALIRGESQLVKKGKK